MKRIADVILSGAGLVVLSPLLLLIALMIRLTSPGPALYRAARIGKDAIPFQLYKFRSMVVDADRIGPAITVGQDPRVTPIGRMLRRTKLDELPQLLNVLRGDMSLVGPRPEDPRFLEQYTREQRRVLDVRPGITSPASVAYRNEEALLRGSDWERVYREQLLPAKLALDLEYAKEPTLRRDVAILLKTAVALLH
jgi:lipopolysaccharide/colanic/teichoic acid biosynthesis glycosyltransferase